MQRALTSIIRRSLLQQQRTRSVALPSSALFLQASSLRRQFSVSSIKLNDKFASNDDNSSFFPSLSGEDASNAPSYSDRSPQFTRPDAKLGLFVGGLDHNIRDDDLKRIFSQFGEVTDANVLLDRATQRSKRCGFVYFTNITPVENLLADSSQLEHLTELGPSPGIERITRKEREPRQDRGERRERGGEFGAYGGAANSKGQPSDTIFVSGFPFHMTRAQIEEILTEFYPTQGIVKDFRVPVNRLERIEYSQVEDGSTGDNEPQNKGYAFVRMGNEEEAQNLLDSLIEAAKSGFVFPGSERTPTLRFASPQKPFGGAGGAGGNNRSFGGREGGRGSYGGGGGNRFNGGGDRQRRTSNPWFKEERSRFQGGRGDEY